MRKSTRNLTVNQKTRNFLEDVLPTITNADLDSVEEWAELVLEEVEGKRAKYADAIERAEAEIENARDDQNTAETEEEFDAALDRLQRNEGKLRFNEHKLQALDRTPRMNEEAYDEKLELIHEIMEDGAAEFQRTVSKAAAEIILARETTRAFDETIRINAEVNAEMGLETRITRTYGDVGLHAGTPYAQDCEWCLARCGEWTNVEEAKAAGVFERHPGCQCTVDYKVGKTHTRSMAARRGNNWNFTDV